MENQASARIGRFEVIRRLGAGMQGQVYLGWDPKLERQVALKLVTLDQQDDDARREVVSEARIAAKISHPNVVPIFEADMHQNTPVLVFEYVDGIPLKEKLKADGAYSENDALSMMTAVAGGMKCAHDQGIAHLDLSPNNIMVDVQGQPRIMDFGLAKVAAERDKDAVEGNVSGTPRYMSPEHFSADELSPATDIFALGLVFFELLLGKPAILGDSVVVVIQAIGRVAVDWSRLSSVGISAEVIALIRDMLHPDPQCRIKDAGELVAAIDDVVAIKRSEEQGQLALDFLMRRLQRRPEFPAFSSSIVEINRLTAEDSAAGYDSVAAVILRDFSLTNRVMKIANSAFFDRGGEGVKTISNAIARLGLNLVRMITNGLMMFDQAENREPGLTDALVASFVAGLFARHLVRQSNRRLAEEAFICGLFHKLGTHLVMYYLVDEHEDILSLAKRGVDIVDAERQVLSTTTAALGKAVAAKWNFPDSIISCMTRLTNGAPARVESENELVCAAVNFANEFCDLVRSDEAADEPLDACAMLARRYRGVFEGTPDDLVQLMQAALNKFVELAPDLGINVRGSAFCKQMQAFVDSARPADAEPAASSGG